MIHMENLSVGKLEQVIKLKRKMNELEDQLRNIISGGKRTHNVSPEGRKRISQAVKNYWKRQRGLGA